MKNKKTFLNVCFILISINSFCQFESLKKDTACIDNRSTVYWNPGISTNDKGEAEFSFYTSDSKSSYLVIVQGTDMNGGLGAAFLPLLIKKEQ